MAELDLSGVYAKMAWARGHFHAVDAEIETWTNDKTHQIIYGRNEDLTQHYLIAEFGSKPRTDRWPLMIGDCVTNLRDTLDHVIYGIAHLPSSPMPTKAENAAFVIAQTQDSFAIAKGRLISVPDAVRDAVLSFQPFNRPHPILPPLLSILAELANGSKHKLLNVVLTVPHNLDVEFVSSREEKPPPGHCGIPRRGIIEGAPFFVFETPAPDPNLRLHQAHVGFGISVAHSPLPGDTGYDASHTGYRPLLQALFDEVELVIKSLVALV